MPDSASLPKIVKITGVFDFKHELHFLKIL